jgi:hypothetical protein
MNTPLLNLLIIFMKLKKNAKNQATRFIAKMSLNQLYGYMGRDRAVLETILVNNNELKELMLKNIVQSVFEVPNCLNGEELYIVLINSNLNDQIFDNFNDFVKPHAFNNSFKKVKSNVAISSAVTAYGRIHMAWFKQNFKVLYSDTDSIFIIGKLPDYLIGNDIGLMKHELNGILIDEAIFLGNKKYNLKYVDPVKNESKMNLLLSIFTDLY